MSATLVMLIVLAIVFDFTNGFHDTANSIATMVGTRALSPKVAVAYAAILNFAGAMVGVEIAATIGKGIITATQDVVTLDIALAGLTGAIVWNLVTWFYGLPSSSSHALVGGLVGAALAAGKPVIWNAPEHSGVVGKVIVPSLVAPAIGLVGCMVLMLILMRTLKGINPRTGNRAFKRAQILSGGFLSFTHGQNDGQKTMGVMMLGLIAAGQLSPTSGPPLWVRVSAGLAMGLGTYAGGWKIIKTLGGKIVKMSPMQGFSASVAAATILKVAEHNGFPLSTTHTVTGCVLGAGSAKRLSSVRWTVVGEIVTAWVMTLPMAAIVGAAAYLITDISPVLLALVSIGMLGYMRLQMARAGAVPAH
ncbi:MAG: phosphate transporter [Thermoleophilia bacterium]|nr:phosphate transporter [Thermoleophilia bacterium]